MKIATFLIIIILLMHLSTLVNITFFNGDWNGINLALHTLLFIAALSMYAESRKAKES